MRWQGRERSENVEDRRGARPAKLVGGGGLVVVVIAIIAMLLGADPRPFLGAVQQQQQAQVRQGGQQAPGPDDKSREFIEGTGNGGRNCSFICSSCTANVQEGDAFAVNLLFWGNGC